MSDSIIQTEKECFVTGSTNGLQKHHCFRGSLRKAADDWGCWVWLRSDWHVGTSYAVHNNRGLELHLRRVAQEKFEALYGHEKFMQVFGKNEL